MYAVIGTIDGRPQDVAVVNTEVEAVQLAESLRRQLYYDRVDVKATTGGAALLLYVQDEVEHEEANF